MAAESAKQMPATPRTRPSRMRPQPPACSSVQRIRPPAPRAKSRAAIPHAAATGTAHTASTSRTPAVCRDTTTAAGTTTVATRPRTTASDARWLLLDVGAANSCRWDRAADHAGDGDQRQDVRKRLEEYRRRVGVRGEAERERGRRAEEDRRRIRAERPPVPEDHGGERDEAAPVRHALVERAEEADREVGAAERGEDPRNDDRDVAGLVDRDPDGVRRTRMLADRAETQADGRAEQHDPGHDEQKERE